MSDLLTKKEQKELLKIARETIVDYVTTGKVPVIESTSPGLNVHSGCFVTIKQKGGAARLHRQFCFKPAAVSVGAGDGGLGCNP